MDRLLAARNQGGLWRDFFDRARPAHTEQRVTGYASDEWVTAYVAWALASTGLPRARAAAEEALSLLLSRRDNEAGWGYHALLPPDADTTTWVLRLAGALGRPDDDRLMAGRRFVQGLVGPTGGVSTYERGAARPLADFLRMEGTYVLTSYLRYGRSRGPEIEPGSSRVRPPRPVPRRALDRALVARRRVHHRTCRRGTG